MNWLTCESCGRSVHSCSPPVVESLASAGIKLACPCGHADRWKWYEERPVVVDLPWLAPAVQNLRSRVISRDFPNGTGGCDLASSVQPPAFKP